ncbi:myosin heavy chain, cardiac muscle isoform-like isoform X1 [Clytia hemisphaerica]|uniref:Uncharacterized protein n=1 Tax=Clytia hemisphaerica TaxID=252671 RepID=A0A7M5UPL7_9CNID
MAQENDESFVKEICRDFIPQKWRKTKCQTCFKDIIEHTKGLTHEESETFIKQCMDETDNDDDCFETQTEETFRKISRGRNIITSTSTIVAENEQPCFQEPHCHQHHHQRRRQFSQGRSSKENSLDVDVNDVMKGRPVDSENEADDPLTENEGMNTPLLTRRKRHSSGYPFEHMDSHENTEDGTTTPNRISSKSRSRSRTKGKSQSNLLSLSAMMLSSNSSLCSYTSELTDGYSDYDYDVRSITDDTDDYADIPDVVIEELELIKPELKARVENERRVSRSRIISLERELEGQHDYHRASEVARDRQLKSLQRDIEGLKLELSSVKAHENILALKSRLELEGKNSRIHDLEQQNQTLKEEIQDITNTPNTNEAQQELLIKELERARKWIDKLEEENRAVEERKRLAEDLQKNDKELIDILRNQCGSLEEDLTTEQDRNSQLEDKLKLLDMMRSDFLKEQEKHVKTTKELESMRQKIKRRDRHIEDLEDDNVKLQQLKQELESNMAKKEFKIKKVEKKVSVLQHEVIHCNKQIADLTGENKTLEQVKRLTDLKLKDMSSIAQQSGNGGTNSGTTEVATNEQFFINTLEDRLKHRESRLKELELENDNYLKEIKGVYDNLLDVERQREECKEQIKDNEIRLSKLRKENKNAEKKIELLHRKLQKSEKEKRRALNKQTQAEMKLSQYHQEQESVAMALSAARIAENTADQQATYDSSDDSDSRILKLKLQSTEARLSMIEVNKGYLESKVINLERKLMDKEQEILRLNDSMERDSGAPSQDYDRFDALERENIMLQTKLDELSLENAEQKDMVNKLKEGNTHLEKTIQNLNTKLDSCTFRLKELEEANHKLGREALKRNESISCAHDEVTSSLNELKEHNKTLQDKLKHFENVEDLVEQLEQQVKMEQSYVQWYFDENEKLKIQTAKMADTIRTLERSKFEFEQSVRELSDTNKDLNNDVKRLEQKLEIYTELFDKDSNFHTSLKRRSYQGGENNQEQADEKLIENALAPLMEEIKEKDSQIRNLQKLVEEKDVTITSLNKEIDTLETNLASMVMEKIRGMQIPDDAEKVRQESAASHNGLFSTDSLQELKQAYKLSTQNDKDTILSNQHTDGEHDKLNKDQKTLHRLSFFDDSHKIRIGEPCTLLLSTTDVTASHDHSTKGPQVSPTPIYQTPTSSGPQSPSKETYLALTSKTVNSPKEESTGHYEQLYSGSSSNPTSPRSSRPSSNIYQTIESAILDQYRGDDQHCYLKSNIPPLDSRHGESPPYTSYIESAAAGLGLNRSDVDRKSISNMAENKALVDDMYDQLALLEDLVSKKNMPPPLSPSAVSPTKTRDVAKPVKVSTSENDTSNDDSSQPASPNKESGHKASSHIRIPKLSQRQSSRESNLGLPSNTKLLCRTPSTSSSHSQDSTCIDLSGLDDLLAEVDGHRGGSHAHEKYASVVQESKRRSVSGLEHKPVLSKTMPVPSIRNTRRRIIKVSGLNRTGSFDSTRVKPKILSSNTIISHSSSSLPSTTKHRNVNVEIPASRLLDNNTSTSSLATSSSSSVSSVIYVPDKDGNVSIPPTTGTSTSQDKPQTTSATGPAPTSANDPTSSISATSNPPFRRPSLKQSRFLTSNSNIGS